MTLLPHLRILFVAVLVVGLMPAQDEKNYRLFVGVDLLVPKGDTKIPVENLRKNEVVVSPADGDSISMRDVSAFSWARSTKISRAPITISDFEAQRDYSVGNDKRMQYMSTQNNMAIYQQERTGHVQAEAAQARRMQGAAYQVLSGIERAKREGMAVDPRTNATAQAFLESTTEALDVANIAMADQFHLADSTMRDSTLIDRATGLGEEGGEDILELTFKISSLVPIADAYIVVMGHVTQDDEEGMTVFHQNIGTVGPEPRNIHVRKTGFKPGFTIKDVNVHVYTHGKEIATNRSEKNVALTHAQAREYLLLTHTAQHQRETVAAQPVWILAPPALLGAKSRELFNYPVVVNVDADGSIMSIHESEAEARVFLEQILDSADIRSKSTPTDQTSSFAQSVRLGTEDSQVYLDQGVRIPPLVVAALNDMFFLPALELGTPIADTTTVNLADFYR